MYSEHDRAYQTPVRENVLGYGTVYTIADPDLSAPRRFAGALIHDDKVRVLPVEGCPLCLQDHSLTVNRMLVSGPFVSASCDKTGQETAMKLIGVGEAIVSVMRYSEAVRRELLGFMPSLASVL